jgi:aryl-alcohol dehydrogenase-like predicted oxidoreductase
VYYRPEVFGVLDDLMQAGKLCSYGVSVEKVEEGLKAIEYPAVQSVQIVFNIFRQRPAELFFAQARRQGVGILARLPLSSGLLTGKFHARAVFERDDHRAFNRKGEAFDRGETFSGLDFALGLKAVESLRPLTPPDSSLAQMALRWILMFPEVTCAIPGAKRPEQVEENVSASDLPALTDETMKRIRAVYDGIVRKEVHHRW